MIRYLIIAVVVSTVVFIVFKKTRGSQCTKSTVGVFKPGDTLLFGLPTICDPYPPLAETPHQPVAGEVTLHEDDWRQIEFVSIENQRYIEDKLTLHQRFRGEKRQGQGYTANIARPEHPIPFSRLGVSQSGLCKELGLSSWQPLSINWLGGVREVGGGFAASLGNGIIIYGYSIDNTVQQLGLLVQPHQPSISCPAILYRLAEFVNADLVDWYGLARVSGSNAQGLGQWWANQAL